MQLKGFCPANKLFNQVKRQPTEWEIIFASCNSGRECLKCTNNSKVLNNKRTNPIFKNGLSS